MEVREVTKKKLKTKPKGEVDDMIKKLRKEDERLVKGRFEFTDAKGGWIDFAYRKWPGDPLMVIKLTHGEICEIPFGIVKHLNNTVKKIRVMNPEIMESGPVRGVPVSFEVESRTKFIPMDYL